MFIYVLSKDGQPLMPTQRCCMIRKALKSGKVKVIKRCPFTVQLNYEIKDPKVQSITLGVDAGSKTIGLSATTESKELFASNVTLRNDITDLLTTRRELRRTRRNRKTRYRQSRFNNRAIPKGWLPPSTKEKIYTHIKVVEDVHKILPINKIIVECAAFDVQKIQNPNISGIQYQQGPQLDFWNVREYVLHRDGHKCQSCNGKSKDPILNVHHIIQRKDGGSDAPSNLITLCETCHKKYHQRLIKLPAKCKKPKSYKDAAFMTTMRWAFYETLKSMYPNVSMTYGYFTKYVRIRCKLKKDHYIDARCISCHPLVKELGYYYQQQKVRCHNRQIHKMTINKGGTRKKNQTPFIVYGFRLFDKVKYLNTECFIFGRRSSGSFDIRRLNGVKISSGISYKKLTLLTKRKNILIERINY